MKRGLTVVAVFLLAFGAAFGQSKPDPINKHTPVVLNSNEHALPSLMKELDQLGKMEPVSSNNKGVQPTLPQNGKATIRKKAETSELNI